MSDNVDANLIAPYNLKIGIMPAKTLHIVLLLVDSFHKT